jgi:plasmid stabilization system protein ParE
MASAIWTEPARDDLKSIGRYLGREQKSPRLAAKILRELKASADEYSTAFAQGSIIGSEAAELGENCRVFSHKRWVVVFEPSSKGIEVLRIFDGSRDYPRLFGS